MIQFHWVIRMLWLVSFLITIIYFYKWYGNQSSMNRRIFYFWVAVLNIAISAFFLVYFIEIDKNLYPESKTIAELFGANSAKLLYNNPESKKIYNWLIIPSYPLGFICIFLGLNIMGYCLHGTEYKFIGGSRGQMIYEKLYGVKADFKAFTFLNIALGICQIINFYHVAFLLIYF